MTKPTTTMEKLTARDKKTFHRLAQLLCSAYIADQAGIGFVTAQKNYCGGQESEVYGKGKTKLGDYWYLLAIQVTQQQLELRGRERRARAPQPRAGLD